VSQERSPNGNGKDGYSVLRDPAFALFVGSATLTCIGIYKLAVGQPGAAVVICVVAAGLGLIAKQVLKRRKDKEGRHLR